MKKAKLELWRVSNHIIGYGLMREPAHDVEETICNFINSNNARYCFHKISYEEPPYEDGMLRISGPWNSEPRYKKSHEYFVGCELEPDKIKKPWKFGDYIKYVTVYYEEGETND